MSAPKPKPDQDDVAPFVLDFLVSQHPALFSVDELTSEFAGQKDQVVERLYVDEAIIRLVGHGLAHRLGDFVFASRAAVRGHELTH